MVNIKRFKSLICVLCFALPKLWSVEQQPWVGNYLEFEWRTSFLYQTYRDVSSNSFLIHRHADDRFLSVSLANAIKPELSLELEATVANTRKQTPNIDNFRLAGRYMWLDDIAGDPISLTTVAIFTQSFKHSLKDISSFHHGRSEVELDLSVGKEITIGETWDSRWWFVGGLGTAADRGSSWLRADYACEYRFRDKHEIQLFIHSLWGLGSRRLHVHDFEGYGPIQHQSVDVGSRYTYQILFFGSFSLEYAYRLHARNFPAHTHQFLARLLYTFGL